MVVPGGACCAAGRIFRPCPPLPPPRLPPPVGASAPRGARSKESCPPAGVRGNGYRGAPRLCEGRAISRGKTASA
eukprot:7580202-Pyramimonas_sp.AAC.1